jgi:hypothetical protein
MLNRLDVTHTRGEGYALSPDEQFEAKRAFIEGVRMRSETEEPEPEKSEAEGGGRPEKSVESGEPDSTSSDFDPTDRLFYLDDGNLGFPSPTSCIRRSLRSGRLPGNNRPDKGELVDKKKGACWPRWTQKAGEFFTAKSRAWNGRT